MEFENDVKTVIAEMAEELNKKIKNYLIFHWVNAFRRKMRSLIL